MSEIDGTRTICIPPLAFNYVNNRLESIGYQGELYARESYGKVPELGEREDRHERESYSRWYELFGTHERAARTMAGKCSDCCECVIADYCEHGSDKGCLLSYTGNYDALLEWLKQEVNA